MIFSTPIFLFVFFPITFILFFLLPSKYRNYWIIICSIVFYAWSGIGLLLIFMSSTLINYFLGIYLEKQKRWILCFSILFNLGLLCFFKYNEFTISNLLALFPYISTGNAKRLIDIVLPVGISFYTFRFLSYDIDVYLKKIKPQRNYFKLLLYFSMFPYLIAGPIVRYADIEVQIESRVYNSHSIYFGLKRFISGLGKKVILADTLSLCTENLFGNGAGTFVAWLGMITYSLQIYFDFAGYSDMAIGMGKMLGFDFKENFNRPYYSNSIKDFWRRWHISLSSWFRDYLYVPLGGNRKGTFKTYRNLFLVFLATGLWHGASWNFVVWGLWHGSFIIIERLGLSKILRRLPIFAQRLYTLLVVGIGWLMFRTENIFGNLLNIKDLFVYRKCELSYMLTFLEPKSVICILISIAICIIEIKEKRISSVLTDVFSVLLFFLVILQISASGFSPFLYFRF